KMRTQHQKWYAGETISVSIGQGNLQVTPIQLARAIGGLALGGVWHHPHLVPGPDSPSVWSLTPANVKLVVDGMYGVVNDPGFITGGRARIPGIEVCGKTGSAQLASNEYLQGAGRLDENARKDNAWFVGFAPRSAPEIVVVALWDHGEHGQFAAPIVRDVLKAYFDKKVRVAALQQQQQQLAARMASIGSLGLPAAGAGESGAMPAAAAVASGQNAAESDPLP
ncbi:MAG: penicillin-binding transpeptidase domain-containing protein, partial [Bryobacteraceae bacterium]